MTNLEVYFLQCWNAFGCGVQPEAEYRFHPVRRWRFDFAWPSVKVAVECEGGTWTRGRHTRGSGYRGDCEKYNVATAAGWRVFRCTRGMLDEDAREFIGMVGDAVLCLKPR